MQPIEMFPGMFWVGVNDRCTELFEGLWQIRDEGISYNSYLINDQKKAIIDLGSKATALELLEQIRSVIDPAGLDYIVINHMEPDHSGALKLILQAAPHARLLGSAKTVDMLAAFYGITENIQVVGNDEEINLGSHTLKFIATPFVHWPETIMTYETSRRVLFSCDGFGGYGALNGSIFDDAHVPLAWYEEQALRYFVNIVASFSKPVKNAVAKLENLPIDMIAPSHGLIWRNSPRRIVDLYSRWAGYAGVPGDPGVTLLYASMYGNTECMMEAVAQGIADEGVPLNVFNVSKTSISEILPSIWLRRGVMVGAPTYEGGMFPDMANVLKMIQRKHIFNKTTAGFGSHAWNGGSLREFTELVEALRWETFGTLEFKGAPGAAGLMDGRRFGAEFARRVMAG